MSKNFFFSNAADNHPALPMYYTATKYSSNGIDPGLYFGWPTKADADRE